jgi:hypothetical protein
MHRNGFWSGALISLRRVKAQPSSFDYMRRKMPKKCTRWRGLVAQSAHAVRSLYDFFLKGRSEMSKPTVFFSHSSKDGAALSKLKELFTKATGGSVDTFLSSDGQSIPLGRNWVHRIEEALNSARLMFVFVTADSLRSEWIFFESGFAYAKAIRVIPVGFLGADLKGLTPPLSLLQGFNIKSAEGLNNILAIVNTEFNHSHSLSFSNENYQELAAFANPNQLGPFGDHGHLIDEVRIYRKKHVIRPTQGWVESERIPQALYELVKILDNEKHPYVQTARQVEMPGMSIEPSASSDGITWTFRIEPSSAVVNLQVAGQSLRALFNSSLESTKMDIVLSDTIVCEKRRHVVSGRMIGTGATLGPNDSVQLGDLEFRVGRYFNPGRGGAGPTFVQIGLLSDEIPVEQIRDLLSILFDKRILSADTDFIAT